MTDRFLHLMFVASAVVTIAIVLWLIVVGVLGTLRMLPT